MNRISIIFIGLLTAFLWSCDSTSTPADTETDATMNEAVQTSTLWVGTYTRKEGHVDGKAEGIYRFSLNDEDIQRTATIDDIVNPSFVTLSPNGKTLYAVSEIGGDVDTCGYVYAYELAEDGTANLLGRQPTYSFAPCHVTINPTGNWLYVTNYVGGMIVRYPLGAKGAILPASDRMRIEGSGPHERQEDSHPHSSTLSPDGKWLMIADLGTDRIRTFVADQPQWEMKSVSILPAGSGPRHMTFHPKAAYAYAINELNNTVTAFRYLANTGSLAIIEHYTTLPANFDGSSFTADIHITPDGHYLYATNRGHNSLVAFQIDQSTGQLTLVGHTSTEGDFPRNFAIQPDGASLWVANQNTDNILRFAIDANTGQLNKTGEWRINTPVCLAFQ